MADARMEAATCDHEEIQQDLLRPNDLERFIHFWKNDPVGMCHFVGRAVAECGHHNYPELLLATGAGYFAHKDICERIDFIYEHYADKMDKDAKKAMNTSCDLRIRNDIVCLSDISGRHGGMQIMLLKKESSNYAIRMYSDRTAKRHPYLQDWGRSSTFNVILTEEDGCMFWNFRPAKNRLEGVIVHPPSEGFSDLWTTKSVADFVVLVSNLFGYYAPS